jgi:ATP-dependent RNA helicase DeaD
MKHVIHYHLPSKQEEFIHRNGRTARMLASGTAYILHHQDDKQADYIDYQMKVFTLKKEAELPKPPAFQTLYVSGGKKTKLRKMDIVGFFMQTGNLSKDDIGLIEVKDFSSFIAVKSKVINALLSKIENQKMKGKKYKIEIARPVIKKEE